MEKFTSWLQKNKINMDSLQIKEIEHNERNVVAIKPIDRSDTVMLIPKNLLIMSPVVEKTANGKKILSLFLNETELTKSIINISVFILFSMENYAGYNTFWDSYFDILPKDLSHIPLFWKKNELNYLKGSQLLIDIRDRLKKIRSEYNKLKKNIKDFDMFSFYEYKRIRSLVSSRNFRLTINGIQSTTMVPLADMLNHSNNALTRWGYSDEKNGYEMKALENIESGTEITDSYGKKDNHKYFLYYGFVLENGFVKLHIKTRKFDGFIDDKMNSISMENLLNYLRRIFLDKEQKFRYGFLSVYNEKKVFLELRKIFKRMKKKYIHSNSYYEKYKNKGSLNKRNAYILILQELKIINSLIDKVNIILEYLRGDKPLIEDYDIKDYLKKTSI